jgi:hypothetical protein
VREIIAVLTEALGREPNAVEHMRIVHAATTSALLEGLQARALRGDPSVTPEQLVKVANTASRALRVLCLPALGSQKRGMRFKPLQWR